MHRRFARLPVRVLIDFVFVCCLGCFIPRRLHIDTVARRGSRLPMTGMEKADRRWPLPVTVFQKYTDPPTAIRKQFTRSARSLDPPLFNTGLSHCHGESGVGSNQPGLARTTTLNPGISDGPWREHWRSRSCRHVCAVVAPLQPLSKREIDD